MHPVDLRSDIVSTPTEAMIRAMSEAARKPRGFGMREDADQQALEALSARLLDLEDALFFPTCTMANQAALLLHCPRGSHVLADRDTHLCGTEASSTAGISGVTPTMLSGRRGHLGPAEVEAALKPAPREAQMPIRLVWLENTHNLAGGTVMPAGDFAGVVEVATRHGVPVHVDGSRLWNAVAVLGCTPADAVRGAASVAFSLNKVLGAPLGAVLAGSRRFIADALRVRNMLGGGMRPAGLLAAAGIVALEQRDAPIAECHRRTARLADALIGADLAGIDRESVQTNIIVARPRRFAGTQDDFVRALRAKGVLVNPHGTQGIRIVLHASIDDDAVGRVIDAFGGI